MKFIILAYSYSSIFAIQHQMIIFKFVLQFLNWNILGCVLILMVIEFNSHHHHSIDCLLSGYRMSKSAATCFLCHNIRGQDMVGTLNHYII